MGDPGMSDTWKKLVIAKANDQWVSISNALKNHAAKTGVSVNKEQNFSLDYGCPPYFNVKTELVESSSGHDWPSESPATPEPEQDPLRVTKNVKRESSEERASRLAKMSAYAAQRLANETPDQRATRLKRMSEYAAKRLANETSEQRSKRLARMSAYAARRLAQETPEQRQARLTRMSAYAAKRHAMKKNNVAVTKDSQSDSSYDDMATITLRMPNQS